MIACNNDDYSVTSSRDTDPTVTEQPGSLTGDAGNGKRLFTTEGCSSCHRTDGRRLVGPGLAGLSGRGDDAYIRQSIREPGSFIVDGYPNVMTDFSGLDDQTVEDLVAYLKTLD